MLQQNMEQKLEDKVINRYERKQH